ncbi:tetratricopeptide repeat protein [Herbidospora daliensis]|uniref:tetratricopeptide repeat protein n=1 Tax=Herbidospora daliensis TaxID=295585 RepID=UPI0007852328|nr:tetratricopeptide repeat protein [Herbidospora daliensis]
MAALRTLGAPPLFMAAVNAHRRLRGPYTFGGALLRVLVTEALERSPGLADRFDIEIDAVLPGSRERAPGRRRPIDATLPDDERILVPAPRRTLRLANGIAELALEVMPDGVSLVADNVHEADPTDLELLQVLSRRLPGVTVIMFDTSSAPRDVIDSDGTTDDPAAWAAYEALDPADRRDRHDRRAAQLGPAEMLGALPWHLERGSDPCAAAEALWAAVDRCVGEGFLHAVVELGHRGLALSEPGSPGWWRFAQRTATALGGLGRRSEALEVYDQARRASVDPAVHAASAYGTAMLDARHPDPAQRDLGRATAWINQAIAISTILPDPHERAFKLGFDQNGKALIELRQGRLDAALDLVESALSLTEELPVGAHPLHRMVLLANRAQLLATMGNPKEALHDLDRAIAYDPAVPDHYLDRGNLRLRLGQTDAALADYETAMAVGPPLPEAFYNRGELRLGQGDLAGARADFDHVLELDPGFLNAYVNRAGILEMLDDHEAARADVRSGLELDPRNPHLHAVLGQLETAQGDHAAAMAAFDVAIEGAPDLAAIWANRGILRYESGDAEGALADLTRALELDEDAAVYFNRAVAHRALGQEEAALDDLRRAHDLDPDDPDIRHALGT